MHARVAVFAHTTRHGRDIAYMGMGMYEVAGRMRLCMQASDLKWHMADSCAHMAGMLLSYMRLQAGCALP